MNNSESRNPAGDSAAPGHRTGNSGNENGGTRPTRCVTGTPFIMSMYGIMNIIIFASLLIVLIAAGIADSNDGRQADKLYPLSSVKVSAVDTRNAVIAFAVFGLILIGTDTFLHVTSHIYGVPAKFDLIFIVVMLSFASIYFILGCCAAAWEKKMEDTLGQMGVLKRKGAAGAASAFLFISTIAVLVDFIFRLTRPLISNET